MGTQQHLILLQAPAAASGRSSSRAGGWARGWHLGQLNRSSSNICMLVRRWAPPLEEEMRVLPATAGSSSLCQSLSCTHHSSVHAYHISQLLQLAPWSTTEGPFMQSRCQQHRREEGSDPRAAPPARRDTKISSCRRPSSPSLWYIFCILHSQTASQPLWAVVRCTTAGTIRDCKRPPGPTPANRWQLDALAPVGSCGQVQICILPTTHQGAIRALVCFVGRR